MTTAAPSLTSVETVANRLVNYCRELAFETAMKELYAYDAVSIESVAMPGYELETVGRDNILASSRKWGSENTVHSITVSEPLISEGVFAVQMSLDVTSQNFGGQRLTMSEIAVYQVSPEGQITQVNFYYPACG